uniref:Uncharacterized protein n=1 Tax=Kwoniella pini CBS 10737 TaxID=1296096 RepID=A0A1B9HSS3_9TREE|nr:uncharacterized protein I206_07815 [Kwoniella pini CBS 10737]OCF46333.1 hypothetical protein I206_07815 [Kwoniella pini CBS 10737]
MSKIFVFLMVFTLCLSLIQAKPIITPTRTNSKVTRNDRLTNSQRIARGLPPRAPVRLYDPTAPHHFLPRAS